MKLVAVIVVSEAVQFKILQIPEFKEICGHEVKLSIIRPKEGHFEQDPLEILKCVRETAEVVIKDLPNYGFTKADIHTIGITNSRETVIAWCKLTGVPLYNAITWKDTRTNDETIDNILAKFNLNPNYLKEISGLPTSSLSSSIKIKWLRANVSAVSTACRERRCLVGTLDSWLMWNLTKVFVTDVTNASRTQLMNLETLNWDPMLLKTFSVNAHMLPEIRSSSEIYGTVCDGSVLDGLKISAIMGNQQASLVGQLCFKPGQAKSTYRSGCFLLCNIGEKIVHSTHGLATVVAYKMGPEKPAIFALEGSVAVAGFAMKWLKNNLRLMENIYKDSEEMAGKVSSCADVYFVPAFTGLYAPYWRKDARGVICGLTAFTTKNHIIRAGLETICYQNFEIIEAMKKDAGIHLSKLNVDGKMSNNDLLMQIQADISGIPILRSDKAVDTAVIGCAIAAAQADGINLIDLNPYYRLNTIKIHHETFLPTTVQEERICKINKWRKAVQRSYGWVITKKDTHMTEEKYKLLSSLPFSVYLFSSFLLLAASEILA